MMQQREIDGQEIARLQNQLSMAANTTLSKLQKLVIQSENTNYQSYAGGRRYEQLTREELSKALDEKDEALRQMQVEIQGLEKNKHYLQEKLTDAQDRLGEAEHELRQERQQLELKARSKELDKLKLELKKKDVMMGNLSKTID